jgi:putative ubiquitin-RnfH superfamily antitoxin RatB of RatAB toxin-antitoxin module
MTLRITVAVAFPERQEVLALELPEGSSAADAIAAAGLRERFPGLDVARCRLGIWSRACEGATALREGDRVEVYRPLQADAKAMRRSRARLKPSNRSRNEP